MEMKVGGRSVGARPRGCVAGVWHRRGTCTVAVVDDEAGASTQRQLHARCPQSQQIGGARRGGATAKG
jgi:hypothetical protein